MATHLQRGRDPANTLILDFCPPSRSGNGLPLVQASKHVAVAWAAQGSQHRSQVTELVTRRLP